MVWIRAIDHRHDWIAGHDLKHQDFGSVDGRLKLVTSGAEAG